MSIPLINNIAVFKTVSKSVSALPWVILARQTYVRREEEKIVTTSIIFQNKEKQLVCLYLKLTKSCLPAPLILTT